MEQIDGNTQEDKGDPHLQSVSAPAGLCHSSSASMYPSIIHQSLWRIHRTKSYTTFEYHNRHTTAGHLTSFTPHCFHIDGIENPRSAIELSQLTYICLLSVRMLRPSYGAFPFSFIVSCVLSVQYLIQLRPSSFRAHTDVVFDRGLLNALFIALGQILLIFVHPFQSTTIISEMSGLELSCYGREVARFTASFRFLPKSRRLCKYTSFPVGVLGEQVFLKAKVVLGIRNIDHMQLGPRSYCPLQSEVDSF